jgi:membrane protease YdiL (CAAX protease family)
VDYPALFAAAFALLATRYIDYGWGAYILSCLLLMVAVPSALILRRGGRLGEYLIQLGDWRRGLKVSVLLLAVSLPVMYYGTSLPSFQSYYPLWPSARSGLGGFIVFELYVLVIMVCTEFFYRGFLLRTLLKETRYGNVVHAFLYMLAHLGKPPLEVVYSGPVGWLFAKIDLKYKSILPSLTMHYISSVIFDLMILWHMGIRLL